jgi:nucleolin
MEGKTKTDDKPDDPPTPHLPTPMSDSLKREYKAAKKAHAANPLDKALKTAYKAAKKAYKAAPVDTSTETAAPTFSDASKKRKAGEKPKMAIRPMKKAKGTCNRCFVGNLPFAITEEKLRDFFTQGGAGQVEDIYWVTDKETQKFYGSSFVTFLSAAGAETAITLNKTRCMGRPLRVEMCPPKASSLGSKSNDPKKERKIQVQVKTELSARPTNCTTVYLGNLNYQVKDENVHEFFKDCGTITNIRWLTHRDTGNFKGAGYVNFTSSEEVDQAVKKNACIFMGRPLRIDYAESRTDQ